jgi:hypothetical protein
MCETHRNTEALAAWLTERGIETEVLRDSTEGRMRELVKMPVHRLGRATGPRGKISFISLVHYTGQMFEIRCLEGRLFESVEWFGTLEEAGEAIVRYLTADVR